MKFKGVRLKQSWSGQVLYIFTEHDSVITNSFFWISGERCNREEMIRLDDRLYYMGMADLIPLGLKEKIAALQLLGDEI